MSAAGHLQQIDRTYVLWRGRKLSFFGGCDYFRLSSHPKVLAAVHEGLKQYGLSVSSSRRTTGNHPLYLQLEKKLTRFFAAEAALVIGGGYSVDQVVTQALADEFTQVLIDEYSHLALRDAVKMLNCPVEKFRHRDVNDFAKKIRRFGKKARVLVMTDGFFAHNGTVAPLACYHAALPASGLLLVDDAHGAGTLGRKGRGSVEVEGISRRRVVQCITMSKALGVYGGALLCSRPLRERIVSKSHLYAGSTPLPLPLAHAACKSLQLLEQNKDLRRRLNGNAEWVKNALRQAGFELPADPGPIIPVFPASERQADDLKQNLLQAGILPPFIDYPGAPVKAYFRFVISGQHTRAQLKQLVKALVSVS